MTELIFYIDPNEERRDGLLLISMRFTVNHGPDRLAWGSTPPVAGQEVRVYSDGDRARYRGMVEQTIDEETMLVRVKWESIEEDFELPPITGHAIDPHPLRLVNQPCRVTEPWLMELRNEHSKPKTR